KPSSEPVTGEAVEVPAGPAAPVPFVLGASAAVGFVFFLMELVWYRMLAPLLGGSTFTFGLVLAVALPGIRMGGGAYALWFRERRVTLQTFALTCLAEAVCLIIPFAIGDTLAVQAALLRSMSGFGFGGLATSWGIVSALVVLPAAFVSGIQFPVL